MKDWIKNLEDKRKQEEFELEQRLKEEEDKRTRFVPVKEKLLPILNARITELKQRTGIVITMDIRDTFIKVMKPRKHGSPMDFIDDNRFIISLGKYALPTDVHVELIHDTRIDRPGEPPDDMSYADWSGTANTLISEDTDLTALVNGEIDMLLEWLARTEGWEALPAPQIEGVRRSELKRRKYEEEKKREKRQAKTAKCSAYLGLALGILGVLSPRSLFLAGLAALLLGIYSYRMFKKLNIKEGRGYALWAMGLGALTLLEGINRLRF